MARPQPPTRKEGEEEDSILQHSDPSSAQFDLHAAIAAGGTRGLGGGPSGKTQREGEEEDMMLMDTFDPLSHPRA